MNFNFIRYNEKYYSNYIFEIEKKINFINLFNFKKKVNI